MDYGSQILLIKSASIILFVFFSSLGFAASKDDFNWSGNLYKKIRKYNQIHKKFFKQTCSPGTDFKYKKLLKKYRGQGNYLPLLGDDIDRQAIKSNLKHYSKKIKYIDRQLLRLKKQKQFPIYALITKDIESSLQKLLNLKKNYYSEISNEKKLKYLQESNSLLSLLVKQYDNMVDQIYFLKSYNYPNNHLKNRFDYEKYKDSEKNEIKKRANKIFFYRKIVEEGTYNSKNQRSDLYTRSTLDTLYYKIRKQKNFISENVRYDLEWILKNIERFLKEGKKGFVIRLKDWRRKTVEAQSFYQDIIKAKSKAKAKRLVRQRNEATINLKKFVYQKQAEVYHFWQKYKPLWKSLFVLETILYNEVGTIDGENALERKDVAQIVFNRYLNDFYSSLDAEQELSKYLNKDLDYDNERWLNTLFRVGEFSFTYHYISSVSKIFCPDMSRRGKSIRNKNLKISLKELRDFREDYRATRYFSRVSMLGKIDMAQVWTDYEKVPEKPGYEITRRTEHRKLEKLFYTDKYQFLYNFKDYKGVSYQVIKVADEKYAMTWIRGRPRFYEHRNPHLFTYFQKK